MTPHTPRAPAPPDRGPVTAGPPPDRGPVTAGPPPDRGAVTAGSPPDTPACLPAPTLRPDIGTLIAQTLPDALSRLHLTPTQLHALRDIARCRTAALGPGLPHICRDCGHAGFIYPACRNRHCPGCLFYAQQQWLAKRLQRLLPCSYYHVVFTIPAQLRPLFLGNQRLLYDLFFRTVARVLHTLAADPKWLGARLGFTLVLHTWARDLQYHPHLHGLVSAGGLSPDKQWLTTHGKFLFPLGVAASLFKKYLLLALEKLHTQGALSFGGSTARLADGRIFRAFKRRLWDLKWVVYIRKPFGGPEQVLQYLGRYTHRVGLSNSRLLEVDPSSVRFRTRGDKSVQMSRLEFVRRYALHILPEGFTKLRHYGLLAPGSINGAFKQAWEAAMARAPEQEGDPRKPPHAVEPPPGVDDDETNNNRELFVRRCPRCGHQSYHPILDRTGPEPAGRELTVRALGNRPVERVQLSLWRE